MKLLESAENYLETILVLQLKKGYVRSIDIASELQFSKPSVSIAMKKLRENGYINIDSAGHITLTDSGRDVAESVYGRHKVLCSYLMALGVDEENASRDACRIEHIVSEKTMECIRAHAAKLEQEHQNAE
ncbi:MAG: metal-dependent transcriptional regulator [Christensenellaceae bacterium]|jgi:DtxR family Mn-dependent transcriptional regulator|nr:metal-dependent transcriptional regulator [Christensenellaceae bacterium]HIT19998.1 metal-dependent transcriptional regulator [Candidatus Scybalosoma faecavium]